jgi:DNA-directed RNA polymerase alpha subunit
MGLKATEVSEANLVDPTPELSDDTPISEVEFPLRIRNVLAAAGLKTVGEVREISDEILLRFQDLGKASVAHLGKRWACRRQMACGLPMGRRRRRNKGALRDGISALVDGSGSRFSGARIYWFCISPKQKR